MTLQDLLVHVDAGNRAEPRIDLAIALAVRHGARLTGLFAESAALGGSLVGLRDPGQVARAAGLARERFEAKVRAAGLASDWWHVDGREHGDVVGWTVQCCRYVDLAVFGQRPDGDARVPEDLVEEVLLQGGRPALLVPKIGYRGEVGRRVLVAWTGSRASARALNDSLPLLERAEEVTLLSLQLPSDAAGTGPLPPLDATAHLRAHGIAAKYERVTIAELGMVDHVLNRTCDLGADLIVMGAHATHGLRPQPSESTREMLRTLTVPVLLSS